LTNDVVWAVPFQTATELLLKLPPFTVRTKPGPPAVALLGESELTEGVDGQEQATAGSKKIANAPKRGRPFIVEPRVTPHRRVAIRGSGHLEIGAGRLPNRFTASLSP